MIAINHALTGAIIGVVIPNPMAALLAVGSHFVLDAIPHFGDDDRRIKDMSFVVQLCVDAFLCGVLVLILFGASGSAAWLPAICAFLAASPDFMWMPDYLRIRRGMKPRGKSNLIMKFHSRIQWFQRPVGAFVEIAWFVAMAAVLANFI